MHILDASLSTLVLVDYQAKLLPVLRDAGSAVQNATMLADAAHCLGIRIVGTEQNPRRLGLNVDSLRARCETTVEKMHFDACEDGLLDALAVGRTGDGQADIVIAGCESHVCLLQTALGLLRREYRVWVVGSACASRRRSDHRLAIHRLRAAGANVVSPEMVLFEWLRDCRHPHFKAVQQLIKSAPVP